MKIYPLRKSILLLLIYSCQTTDFNQNNWTSPRNQHFLLADDIKNEKKFQEYIKSLDQTKNEQEYTISKKFHDNKDLPMKKKEEKTESWRTDLHKLDKLLSSSNNN